MDRPVETLVWQIAGWQFPTHGCSRLLSALKLLCWVFYCTILIIIGRTAFGDRQTFPSGTFHHPPYIGYLAHMIGVMGQLPVDGICYSKAFLTDGNAFEQIIFFQGCQCIQETFPSLFPDLH